MDANTKSVLQPQSSQRQSPYQRVIHRAPLVLICFIALWTYYWLQATFFTKFITSLVTGGLTTLNGISHYIWDHVVPCCFILWGLVAYYWPFPETKPPTLPSPTWKLHLSDFLSRDAIIRDLAPQIRLHPYHASHLVIELLNEGNRNAWEDVEAFLAQSAHINRLGSVEQFLSWFLRWGVPAKIFRANCQLALTQVQALEEPVQTYSQFLDSLRVLDKLPYLQPNFCAAFHTLITLGSWAQKPKFRKQLQALYKEHPNYWSFMSFLDAQAYQWCTSLPKRPTNRKIVHHIRSGRDTAKPHNSNHQTPSDGVAPNSVATPIYRQRFFTPVLIQPHNVPSTVHWAQGTDSSFISPALLTSLRVTPTDTDQFFLYQPLGAEPRIFPKQVAKISFTIPLLPLTFSFTFIVQDTNIAPILLGCDFWDKYGILCQPGIQFKVGPHDIPLHNYAIEHADFDAVDEDDEVVIDLKMLTLVSDLQLQYPTPPPSLPST